MPEFPIQTSKVQRPPLREQTLQRDRLLDWLQVKIHRRVVAVVAEAGYGKTTLLADFSRRSRVRTLWYRLDEEDRNWVSFLNYLVAAGREVEPGFAPNTLSLLREMAVTGPNLQPTLETFITELRSLADRATALILDDYHLVADVPEIRSIVRELMIRAPERLSFAYLTRRPVGLALSRLRAQGEVAELGVDDLRFDSSETERLFRETFGHPLEQDVLDLIERRTEGWAASLQLVQAALRDRSASEIRRFVRNLSGAHGELYDYLAEEVVGSLDAETQEFLMRSSLLQRVDPPVAAVVTGLELMRVNAQIEICERVGLLSHSSDRARGSGRFHPLVSEFLQARLRRQIGDANVDELHRRVAHYGEARSWRLAAHHYAAVGDAEDVHRILVNATQTIMGTGEFALAESYIAAFPPSSPMPWFEIVLSRRELQAGRVSSALERARAAVHAFADTQSSPDAHLAIANLMSVEMAANDLDDAAELASGLLERHPGPILASIARGTLSMLRSSIDGNLDELRAILVLMAQLQEAAGYRHYYGVTMLNLACVDRARGAAETALDEANAAIDALTETSAGIELGSARAVRAWALGHLGRAEAAESELERILAARFEVTVVELHAEAAYVRALYHDPILGKRTLEEVDPEEHPPAAGLDLWQLCRSHNFAQLGRLAEARQAIETSLAGSLSSDVAHLSRAMAVDALIAFLEQRPDCIRRAAAARGHATRQGAALWAAFAMIIQAASLGSDKLNAVVRTVGRDDPAILSMAAEAIVGSLGSLDQGALETVRGEIDRRPARWRTALRNCLDSTAATETALVAARCLDAVGSDEDVPRLRGFVRRFRPTGDDAQLGRGLARRIAPRVFVEDQGRITLRIGDREVPGTQIRRKVLALLCFLLCRSDLSATRDQVLEAMWPELEPDVAANSLNQTLYFLRRVFEPNYREDVSPAYVHYDSDVLWLDQELIASRSVLCSRLLREIGVNPSPDEVNRLSETYQGRFALDFSYEEWAAPYRDWLHARYLEVIERAVTADTHAGQFDRALRLAQRGISVDPDADQIELALLHLYRVTGAHAAAAEQYGHYAAIMRNEVGIEPPPLESI